MVEKTQAANQQVSGLIPHLNPLKAGYSMWPASVISKENNMSLPTIDAVRAKRLIDDGAHRVLTDAEVHLAPRRRGRDDFHASGADLPQHGGAGLPRPRARAAGGA
mgnify:CR=1 FL=1